jgi:hypothetical protein
MHRVRPRRTTLLLALALLALASGCGESAEQSPAAAAPSPAAAPVAPAAPSPAAAPVVPAEPREKTVADYVVWPEGAGEPRDAAADHAECQARLGATAALRDAHPLKQIDWLTRCMLDKGWQLAPDSEIPPPR